MLGISISLYLFVYWLYVPIAFQNSEIQFYKEGGGIHANLLDPIQFFDERYDAEMILKIPESELNYDIGSFDVVLTT
jgi:hypothetical protein